MHKYLFSIISHRSAWFVGAMSLFWCSIFITSCVEGEQLRSKREDGRRMGTGIPAFMLHQIMDLGGGTTEQYNQGIRVFNVSYKKVFKVVQKTLTTKEYPIQKRDLNSGTIESGYRIHDGLFTQGFLGEKIRTKIVANIMELEPRKTKVLLKIIVEKKGYAGKWQHYPMNDYNLDLIDADSLDIMFYRISNRLGSKTKS